MQLTKTFFPNSAIFIEKKVGRESIVGKSTFLWGGGGMYHDLPPDHTHVTQDRTRHPGFPAVQLRLICDQICTGSESVPITAEFLGLSGPLGRFTLLYVDDCLVYLSMLEQHPHDVDQIFEIFDVASATPRASSASSSGRSSAFWSIDTGSWPQVCQ